MEPQNNSQRKIVYNAPGKQFATATPSQQAPQESPQPTQKLPPLNMPTKAQVYNATSVTQDKKGGIINTPPPHPVKPVVTQHMPLPGEPKIEPHVHQPGQTSNPAFRSFAHDIKQNVTEQGITMAQIVMEEERRKQVAKATDEDIAEVNQKSRVLRFVLIALGSIAILGGGVALFITYLAATPVENIATPEDYSPIRAQKVAALELRDGFKNTLIQAVRGVAATRIPEKTFVELKLFETIGTTSVPVSFPRLMQILESRIPEDLLRSAKNDFVLGMYGAAAQNVPFLMIFVDTFENGYVGMINWERTMIGDVGGMFIDQGELAVIFASSTPSLFQDKVYYNKDARVVYGSGGKPLLVWAIINRTQIIITRDGETLNALMNRITLENITR